MEIECKCLVTKIKATPGGDRYTTVLIQDCEQNMVKLAKLNKILGRMVQDSEKANDTELQKLLKAIDEVEKVGKDIQEWAVKLGFSDKSSRGSKRKRE